MLCWLKNELIGSEPNRFDDDLIDTGQDETNLSDDEKYTSQIHQQILEKYIYKSSADIMHTSSTNQNRGYNIEGVTEPVFHNSHSRKHYLARPQHTADSSYEKSIREQADLLCQLMYNDDCGMFISPFEIHLQDSLKQEHNNKHVERNSVVFGTVHQDKTAHNQFEISHAKDISIPLQCESFSDVGFNYDMFNLKTNTKIVTTKKPEASKCCNNLEDSQSNLAGNAQYNTKKTYSNIEQRRNDILPECLKNCYGSLVKKIESNTKESNLFLMTSVLGKIIKVYVSNKMVYVENGVIHNCIDIKQELKVQFDCRINDGQYYASIIWIGEKPHSVVKGRQKDVVYFDIPAKYYGTIENKHQIIANINGSLIHIKVDSVIIYSSEGKQFTEQLESDSLLCLDLVQTYQQEWKILFALLNSMNVINRFLDNWPTKFIESWYFPGYLQSWPANLVTICKDNVIEHCLVKYKIGVCSQETIYPKLKYYVNNGKLHTCEKITSYLKVQFDAHLNADNTRYVIDLIWIGAKPSKIQINNHTKYFNIPAIYYGRHADPQIIARVGETFVPVTVNPNTLSTCFYKSKDKLAVSSVNPNSLLTIRLSEITLEDGFVFKLEFAIIHSAGEKCTAKTIDWPKSYSKYTDVSNKNSKDTCSDVDRRNEISNPLFEKQHEISNPLFEKQHIIEEDNFENISCASCTITYESVNNATIHQTYRSSENTNQPNNLMNTTFPVLKSVLKNNAKHLSNLLHMTGSFAGKYEYHGFIEAQDKVMIFHMNYLYQNGISSNKDINIGKGMSCYGYLLKKTINICNFSVTHIATVAFTGKKPENSEEIISFWKNEFVTEKKQPETEQPISSCSKDFFSPQRDSEDFLCTFKRVCMYSNTFYSNRHIHGGISGIFENQNGSIGFIKAASMTIVFHTDYLFHGTPKLKNLFDSGKHMNLSCFCCQLDNSVNFGEHCVTHVGIVVFTGKKPEDTEEIITSWKSRFVTGKKPVIYVPQKDTEDFFNIFKRVCNNSNVHISCGISGIFEDQEGCIGFIKSKSMRAVFHTEYLFHAHPKLKNLFDLGRRMDLSCLSFQLDNAVYFGELCVTYVGVVVFTGKKPKDSEEIFISWKNRFVKSKDNGKELQVKENPKTKKYFASLGNKLSITSTIQNDPQKYYALILRALQMLGSNISLKLLKIAMSSQEKLLYLSGTLADFVGSVGVLNAGNKTIVFHMNNLCTNYQTNTKIMTAQEKGKKLTSYCFPLPETKLVDNYLVTHYGVIVFGGNKPQFVKKLILFWNKFIRESDENIAKSCSFKAQKTNITQNIAVKNKDIDSTGSAQYEKKDITGKVIKIMKQSILIQFTNHPLKSFEALAHCSLSNIFFDGKRYGIDTEMEINPHLSSSKSLHGIVENLDNPRNVAGEIVNYEMVLGWIGKKPTREEFLDLKRGSQKQQNHADTNISPKRDIKEADENIENTCSVINQNTDNSEQNVYFINNFPSQIKTAKKGSRSLKSVLRELDIIKSNSTSKQLKKGNHKQNQADKNESSASLRCAAVRWSLRKRQARKRGRARQKIKTLLKWTDSLMEWSSPDITPKSTKKKKLGKCQSKDQQPIKNAVTSGIISNIEPNVVEFYTKTGDYFKITRDRCFLYNVCLQAVDLTHILLKDSEVEYELCEGKEVKGIWLPSSSISLDSQDIYFNICLWCDKYNVPDYTRDCLLNTLNWEPTIYVPTVDSDDDTEIVAA